MYQIYAEYRTALDRGEIVAAMALEAAYYRAEERANRWFTIRLTALWAAAAFLPVHLLTMMILP